MKRTILALALTSLSSLTMNAQMTRVIEPAVLEVRYDSWQEEHDDAYILRVGKTTNQFYSYFNNRHDSLLYTNDETLKIALKESYEADDRSPDRSKRLKASTISYERLHQDITTGKLNLYSTNAGAYYTFEEDIPTQEWEINTDSTMTILGMECYFATTFRGRVWNVWFTEEIPVSLGPWKLNGLPGLILKADADNDFIKFTAISITTEGLTPVTFYNWEEEKYYKMTREKFLEYKRRPKTIPFANKVLPPKPYIELE